MAENKYLNLSGLQYFARKLDEKKADIESPVFTGTPTAPTPDGTDINQLVNVEFVNSLLNNKDENLIYVNDHGLKNDGTTDNLAAFNTLYAANPHKILIFTGGTYCFSGQINTYDTHILLLNTTIKFTAAHGKGFNMMGYNREDVIGTIANIPADTDVKEFPSYGEFIRGVDGTIDVNFTEGTSAISIGTGSYFEVSGLTIKNLGNSQCGISGQNTEAVGYQYERIVKDIKIINYHLEGSGTIGMSLFQDSYISNIVIINMRIGISSFSNSTFCNNIHIWNYPWTPQSYLIGTVGVMGAQFNCNGLYLDTVDIGLRSGTTNPIYILNDIHWFVNTGAANNGTSHLLFDCPASDDNKIIANSIHIRNQMTRFSPNRFTSGIFTGIIDITYDDSFNLPTTWNYEHKISTNSPVLTGVPEAPTAETSTSTSQIATTKFVHNLVDDVVIDTLTDSMIDTLFEEE